MEELCLANCAILGLFFLNLDFPFHIKPQYPLSVSLLLRSSVPHSPGLR